MRTIIKPILDVLQRVIGYVTRIIQNVRRIVNLVVIKAAA